GGAVPTGTGLGGTIGNGWMTCYHEGDPKFATLGISKFKCFVIDTTKAATAGTSGNNVSCNGVLPACVTTVPHSRTGYDGNSSTKEFTKIIPDGLLAPGSHVEYFFRKGHASNPTLEFALCPDTSRITSQPSEGSTDQHRWQQFAVLPDRWKSNSFGPQ